MLWNVLDMYIFLLKLTLAGNMSIFDIKELCAGLGWHFENILYGGNAICKPNNGARYDHHRPNDPSKRTETNFLKRQYFNDTIEKFTYQKYQISYVKKFFSDFYSFCGGV